MATGVMTCVAYGCGVFYNSDHSVRLRSHNLRDAGLLPRIPETRPFSAADIAKVPADDDRFWTLQENRESDFLECWRAARLALLRGDFETGERKLRETLERTECVNRPDSKEQELRNAAFDLLDALTARKQGVRAEDLVAYARFRVSMVEEPETNPSVEKRSGSINTDADETAPQAETWKMTDEERARGLAEFKPGPPLEDNVAYFKAALAFRNKDYHGAEEAFRQVVRRFPKSEKREAASFMIGVSILRQAGWADSTERLSEPDEDWKRARAYFDGFLREYPRGRYADDARGWRAFLDLRVGNRSGALIEYYRLLASPTENTRYRAAHSLALVRGRDTEADMVEVQRVLANEPAVARVYTYYELFNAYPEIDQLVFGDGESCSSSYATLNGRKTERVTTIRRLSDFSKKLGAGGDPVFILRSAMAAFLGKDDRAAADLAKRSLEKGLSGVEMHRALWVAGAAELRLHEYKAAVAHFKRLLAEHPDADFEERARRQLAITAEEMGDFDLALEQYFALEYDFDLAYLIDILMTPEQLHGFIERHPDHPQIDMLWYSLGVRYLRDERLDRARDALRRVTVKGAGYGYTFIAGKDGPRPGQRYKIGPPNDLGGSFSVDGIPANWVGFDLQTVEALEQFRQREDAALTRDEKAEVRYQKAGFLYQSGQFLFYNPALWGGSRYDRLYTSQVGDHYRAPGEEDILWRYQQDHENVSRALKVFLSVVDEFPDSKAAPDALYTAAVCQRRLWGYNDYWRSRYNVGQFAWARPVTFQDVKRVYPKYVFPHGTNGWEPMTRTVNGHAAWPPKPKPVPPKPFHIRAWNKVEKGWGIVSPPLGRAWTWTTDLLGTVFGFVFRLDLFVYLAGLAFAAWFFGFRAQRTFIQRLRELPPGNEPPPPVLLLPDFNLTTALGLRYFKFPVEVRDDWWSRLIFSLRWIGWWSRTRRGVTVLSHAMLHGGFAASIWWLCEMVWK
jgi:TolA-binding protein